MQCKKLVILLTLFLALQLTGCRKPITQQVAPLKPPGDDKVLVTFLRPSIYQNAIQFSVWDGDKLVGISKGGSYTQYLTEPGEHIFMARAENWSYVKADLLPGKEYFIIARTMLGFFKARVALDPINKGDDAELAKLDKWMAKLRPIGMIPAHRPGYEQPRQNHVRAALQDYEAGKVNYFTLYQDDYIE